MSNTCTQHNICRILASKSVSRTAAIIPLLCRATHCWVFYLGRERGGKYNLFSGNAEKEDNNKNG